jgi:hypothetical protein
MLTDISAALVKVETMFVRLCGGNVKGYKPRVKERDQWVWERALSYLP